GGEGGRGGGGVGGGEEGNGVEGGAVAGPAFAGDAQLSEDGEPAVPGGLVAAQAVDHRDRGGGRAEAGCAWAAGLGPGVEEPAAVGDPVGGAAGQGACHQEPRRGRMPGLGQQGQVAPLPAPLPCGWQVADADAGCGGYQECVDELERGGWACGHGVEQVDAATCGGGGGEGVAGPALGPGQRVEGGGLR